MNCIFVKRGRKLKFSTAMAIARNSIPSVRFRLFFEAGGFLLELAGGFTLIRD
jgi:hypothetical protein